MNLRGQSYLLYKNVLRHLELGVCVRKKYYSAGGDHLLRRILCYFLDFVMFVLSVSTVIVVIFFQVFCQF